MRNVTKAQAASALRSVERQFKSYIAGTSTRGPILRKDEDDRWEITWEEGPYQWTYMAFCGGLDAEMYEDLVSVGISREQAYESTYHHEVKPPAGVHIEARNHYALSLYPA